jgi:hypothetical protein
METVGWSPSLPGQPVGGINVSEPPQAIRIW